MIEVDQTVKWSAPIRWHNASTQKKKMHYKFAENGRGAGSGRTTAGNLSSHNWPDDLIDIVNEPMGQTLDRMKKYSNSLSQVDRGTRRPRQLKIL